MVRRILAKYASYYNEVRTHVALGKDAPCRRPIERFGDIVAYPILGGWNQYTIEMLVPRGAIVLRQKWSRGQIEARLADQSLAYAMEGLQVELFGSLRRHKLHRRALDCFCDRLGIAEVVLLSL
jgi:hypothetical protein